MKKATRDAIATVLALLHTVGSSPELQVWASGSVVSDDGKHLPHVP